MAARKNVAGARKPLFIDDRWKDKIQAGTLINRLREFANSRFSPTSDQYMAPHQVAAAVALLKKVVPDLSATEHKGEVTTKHVVSPEPTPTEWRNDFTEQPQRPH